VRTEQRGAALTLWVAFGRPPLPISTELLAVLLADIYGFPQHCHAFVSMRIETLLILYCVHNTPFCYVPLRILLEVGCI
jgi:hypothetical protein